MRSRKHLTLFFLVCLSLFCADQAYGLSGSAHTAVTKIYVGGMSTQAIRDIHSNIIDRVPWYGRQGGGGHRNMWGHTEQWYQKGIGSVNRQDVIDSIKDTRLKNVPEPQRTAQANKIYKSLPKDSGRLLIAKEINRYYPGLSPAESKAMADQVYYSHLLGDSTTREGISPLLTQKAENILSRPSKEAMTAMNKTMILEAGENYRRLPYQPVNAERLMVENLAQKQGYKICNFNAKDTIGGSVKNFV